MNSTQHIHRPAKVMNRLMKWPLLCALLGLILVPPIQAADAVYQNDAIINYPDNVAYPPVIDATNFINTGTFTIDFTTLSLAQPFYETSDTLNYTNIGTMSANTGFQFDNKPVSTGYRTMSANIFNSGSISCGFLNGLNLFFSVGGIYYSFGYGYAQCLMNATNIINPGKIDAGVDGLIQMTGKNVNLAHGSLNVEGATANLAGTGIKDLNTNYWDPSASLGPNTAESCFIQSFFYYLYLTNSTAYIQQDLVGTNLIITRAVFLQDTSGPNVTNHVYFPSAALGGEDYAVIEWNGSYLNPADGTTANNYLYLLDDYVTGSDTNQIYFNGIPDNYSFLESNTPLFLGTPAPSGYFPVFPSGTVTNNYSYANAQLISTTVSTNQIPNYSITNLPGRIEVSAKDELNLDRARLTGANYISLQSPKQFEGSPQLVQSPYSDIDLGVTNGFMTISNLVSPFVPNWGGTIQAWSTRWLVTDSGVTNDYRVLLVGSQLAPLTLAQVQNLILHATNSLVISDKMNVMRKFTSDTRNLTLTTNGPGVGATSVDGELNVESDNIYWASCLPNLRNLTNNGAIRFQNLSQFIGTSNNLAITSGSAAVPATGTLSEVAGRANVMAGNKVVIGTNMYLFVSQLTNTLPNQVAVGAEFDGSMSNLIAAINHGNGAGSRYSSATAINAQVVAGTLANHAFTVSAKTAGVVGNTIYTALSSSATNLDWSGSYLAGGADAVSGSTNIASTASVPYDNFINRGLLADQGSAIWAKHFESSGTISNGLGSFNLSSTTTVLTNGAIRAGGDIAVSADSLVASNVVLQAGRSLTLTVTNQLTDLSLTNGNIWTVQSTNGNGGDALVLPIKPTWGDLLGTTITNYAPPLNQRSVNIWAGDDRGVSVNGFTNNAAIGRLVLDALGPNSQFVFKGTGVSNAIYIDDLQFADEMTNGINHSYDFSDNISIGTNMMVYFAQATAGGISIAAKIDAASKAGANDGGRLRWVPGYAGHFSSVNMAYPDGTTNALNAALVGSSSIDSDGDGIVNANDTTPVFVRSQVGLNIVVTNSVTPHASLRWNSIPGATNYVYFTTNLNSQAWSVLTNYVSPSVVPPVGGWPIKNKVLDSLGQGQTRFYKVKIEPNNSLLYGQ